MRFAVISRAVLVLLALAAPAAAQPGSDLGTLAVTVRPTIADVFIDGNRWVSSDPSAPLEVRLAPGRHSIDVRARGYQRFSTIVEVRPGESTPLNVSLLAGSTPQLRGPSAPPPARPGQIQQVSTAGPSGDGFVLAPDFKFTEMNNRTTGFAGFYPRSSGRCRAARPRRVRRDERSDLWSRRPIRLLRQLRVRLHQLRMSLRWLLHRRARGSSCRAVQRQPAARGRHRLPVHLIRLLQAERPGGQHQRAVRPLTISRCVGVRADQSACAPMTYTRTGCGSRFVLGSQSVPRSPS